MHHAQRESRVSSWIDRQVPVGALGGARPVGIDDYQFGAILTGFFNEGPQMHVVAVDIRTPGNDVFRARKQFRIGADLAAENRYQRLPSGGRADGAIQLRGAQAVEEAPVHRTVAEYGGCSRIGIRQDGLRPKLGSDVSESP